MGILCLRLGFDVLEVVFEQYHEVFQRVDCDCVGYTELAIVSILFFFFDKVSEVRYFHWLGNVLFAYSLTKPRWESVVSDIKFSFVVFKVPRPKNVFSEPSVKHVTACCSTAVKMSLWVNFLKFVRTNISVFRFEVWFPCCGRL